MSNLKRIPIGVNVGDEIPQTVRTCATGTPTKCGYSGAYGKYFESQYAQYHNMNNGKGADFADSGIELKSKKEGSESAISIGSCSIIQSTTIEEVPAKIEHLIEKMQEQVIIFHNTMKVTNIKALNLTNDYYQKTLEEELIRGLKRVMDNDYDSKPDSNWKSVKLAGIGYLENNGKSSSWTLRLNTKDLNFADNSEQFDTLFFV